MSASNGRRPIKPATSSFPAAQPVEQQSDPVRQTGYQPLGSLHPLDPYIVIGPMSQQAAIEALSTKGYRVCTANILLLREANPERARPNLITLAPLVPASPDNIWAWDAYDVTMRAVAEYAQSLNTNHYAVSWPTELIRAK